MSRTIALQSTLHTMYGVAIIALLAYAGFAYAEEGTAGTGTAEASISVTSEPVDVLVDPNTGKIIGNRETPPKPGQPLKNKVMENRMEAKGKLMEAKNDLRDFKASTTERMKGIRASSTEAMHEMRDSMKERMSSTSEAFKHMRGDIKDRLASTTAAMKEKLQQKKKELTEKAKERA